MHQCPWKMSEISINVHWFICNVCNKKPKHIKYVYFFKHPQRKCPIRDESFWLHARHTDIGSLQLPETTCDVNERDLARFPRVIIHGVSSYKRPHVRVLFVRPQCRITKQSSPSPSSKKSPFTPGVSSDSLRCYYPRLQRDWVGVIFQLSVKFFKR